MCERIIFIVIQTQFGFDFLNKFIQNYSEVQVFVSKTTQLGVQMKSRNESFGFFVFKNEFFLGYFK